MFAPLPDDLQKALADFSECTQSCDYVYCDQYDGAEAERMATLAKLGLVKLAFVMTQAAKDRIKEVEQR